MDQTYSVLSIGMHVEDDELSLHYITSCHSLRSKSDMLAHVMAMTSSAGRLSQTCGCVRVASAEACNVC